MGKSTISMAIFTSFLYVYQRVNEMMLKKSGKLVNRVKNRSWTASFHLIPGDATGWTVFLMEW